MSIAARIIFVLLSNTNTMRFTQLLSCLAFIISTLVMSCSQKGSQTDPGLSSESPSETPGSGESAELEYESLKDPNEGAFTVQMPKGWKSKIGLERISGSIRECGVSLSPDGKTRLFFGDPSIPTFTIPMPEWGMPEGVQTGNPLSQVRNYVPAGNFVKEYASMAFGNANQFKITAVEDDPQLQQEYLSQAKKAGATAKITAARLRFEYEENKEKRIGLIRCVTSEVGYSWFVNVSGFNTTEAEFSKTQRRYETMAQSYKTDPAWREKENLAFASRMEQDRMLSAQRMQQMTSAHQQRMSDMNSNFQAHQQRMNNLHSSYDNYNQAYQQQMQSRDENHRRFVDVITDKQQIRQGNQVGKAEAGYNQYYVNSSTGQYFGTNSPVDQIPEGYEAWEIDN